MADLSSRQIVQRYVPKQLVDSVNVSVSGLDLSRDGQELLVSYENDQIYTFPMFPRAKNPLCPMPDGFGSSSGITDEEGLPVLNELACYGGHFNRFTFLKVSMCFGCCGNSRICSHVDVSIITLEERKICRTQR